MKYYFTNDDKEKKCELCKQKIINEKYGRLDLCDKCYKEYDENESTLSISNWIIFNRLSNIIPYSDKFLSKIFYNLQNNKSKLLEFTIKITIVITMIMNITLFITMVFLLFN